MDAIKGFFTKYNAVPAGNRGPNWEKASLSALLGWVEADLKLYDAGQRDPHFTKRLIDLRDELKARKDAHPSDGLPATLDCPPDYYAICTAYQGLCGRVG